MLEKVENRAYDLFKIFRVYFSKVKYLKKDKASGGLMMDAGEEWIYAGKQLNDKS